MAVTGAINSLSQVLINQGSNLSYGVRAAARNGTTPEDRRLDYYFRDFYMSVIVAYAFELSFKTIDSAYTGPLLSKQLKLNRLAAEYQDELSGKLGDRLGDINYTQMPPELQKRLLGSFVRAKSHYLIPQLLEKDLQAELGNPDPTRKIQAETLLKHVYKQLDYPQYLAKYHTDRFTPEEIEKITGALRDFDTRVQEAIKAKTPQATDSKLARMAQSFRNFRSPAELSHQELKSIAESIGNKLPQKLKQAVQEGWLGKETSMLMGRVQRSAGWPKIFLTLAANIVYFGIIGNWFDLHVLQPWQQRVSKERGGVKELVAPAYAALIPGAVIMALLSWKKAASKIGLTRLGPATRFALAGAAGVGVYSVAAWAMVQAKLAKLRKTRPSYKSSFSAPTPPPTTLSGNRPMQTYGSSGMTSLGFGVTPPSVLVSQAKRIPTVPGSTSAFKPTNV